MDKEENEVHINDVPIIEKINDTARDFFSVIKNRPPAIFLNKDDVHEMAREIAPGKNLATMKIITLSIDGIDCPILVSDQVKKGEVYIGFKSK